MKTILINGYKGYIASNFFNRFKNKYKIIHYKKDINDIESFRNFLIGKKFSHIIHFAGFSRVNCLKNKKLCKITNHHSIKKMIDQLNILKNKPNFIFISSCHVYAQSTKKLKESSLKKPRDLYGELKLKSENYIKKNYKNSCIIRLFNVYGKNQPTGIFLTDIINKLKKNEEIQINDSIRDFIHINETLEILDFIIKKNINTIVNVGSGVGYKLKDIVKKLASKHNTLKPLIRINKSKKDMIVADKSLLKKLGYRSRNDKKYINF